MTFYLNSSKTTIEFMTLEWPRPSYPSLFFPHTNIHPDSSAIIPWSFPNESILGLLFERFNTLEREAWKESVTLAH